jgi:hypothetical protein
MEAVRWGVAVTVSGAAFAGTWVACQVGIGLDEGAALGVAGAVLAMVLAITGWWAARERPDRSGASSSDRRVVQNAHADRDVNIAGRDQKIINYPRRNE